MEISGEESLDQPAVALRTKSSRPKRKSKQSGHREAYLYELRHAMSAIEHQEAEYLARILERKRYLFVSVMVVIVFTIAALITGVIQLLASDLQFAASSAAVGALVALAAAPLSRIWKYLTEDERRLQAGMIERRRYASVMRLAETASPAVREAIISDLAHQVTTLMHEDAADEDETARSRISTPGQRRRRMALERNAISAPEATSPDPTSILPRDESGSTSPDSPLRVSADIASNSQSRLDTHQGALSNSSDIVLEFGEGAKAVVSVQNSEMVLNWSSGLDALDFIAAAQAFTNDADIDIISVSSVGDSIRDFSSTQEVRAALAYENDQFDTLDFIRIDWDGSRSLAWHLIGEGTRVVGYADALGSDHLTTPHRLLHSLIDATALDQIETSKLIGAITSKLE